jgi:hypothetical protein
LEDLGIDGRIIIWIFNKLDGGMDWIDLTQVIGSCECVDVYLGSIKYETFLD